MRLSKTQLAEFATYFSKFQDCYCVIGGTATLVYLDQRLNVHTKTTKDLDVVVLDVSSETSSSKFAPQVIEIATRRKDGIPLDQAAQRLIELDLSVIVCEPQYLELLKVQSVLVYWMGESLPPVPVAKIIPLIALKAFAFHRLEAEGKNKADKHLNDILRLALALREGDAVALEPQVLSPIDKLFHRAEELFIGPRNCLYQVG